MTIKRILKDASFNYLKPHGPWIFSLAIHGLVLGLLSLMSVSNPAVAPFPNAFQVSLTVEPPQWHSTGANRSLPLNQRGTASTLSPPKPLQEDHTRTLSPLSGISAHPVVVPGLRWDHTNHSSGVSASSPRSHSVSRVLRDQSAQRALANRVPVRFKNNPLPIYPQLARQAGWEGRSMLRVEVLRDGSSGTIEIKESCGHPILDQAAIKAVKEWTFFPERDGMIAVRSVIDLPIRFQLSQMG